MNNKASFSVIIPVYNMEKYLRRCMDSILSQDYSNYEIIAIDDGSTDQSPQILDEYEDASEKVKVIHKENGGIGSAIPMGINRSQNEYIVFVDSDDYVKDNMLSTLDNVIKENENPDIVQFGLVMVDDMGEIVREERHGDYKLNKSKDIIDDHFQNHPTPSLACRCFKKELFENTDCPSQNIGIDEVLIVQLLAKAKNFVSIDPVLYYVYLRENSVSRSTYSEEQINEYEKIYSILLTLTEDDKSLCNYIKIKYLKLMIGVMIENPRDSEIYKRYRRKYKEMFSKLKSSREYRMETATFKLGSHIFNYSPRVYMLLKA